MELGRRSFASLVVGAALSSCTPKARAPTLSFAPRLADERLFLRVQAAEGTVRRMGSVWPGFEDSVVHAMLVYDAYWDAHIAEMNRTVPDAKTRGELTHAMTSERKAGAPRIAEICAARGRYALVDGRLVKQP